MSDLQTLNNGTPPTSSDQARQASESDAQSVAAALAAEFLKEVLRAQNLVVLKTSPGHANSVAVALDNEEWPEVVGTIAGDDTILVITTDTPTGESVQEKLLELLERS
jgi:transcriptional regulator of arginine metabolism